MSLHIGLWRVVARGSKERVLRVADAKGRGRVVCGQSAMEDGLRARVDLNSERLAFRG